MIGYAFFAIGCPAWQVVDSSATYAEGFGSERTTCPPEFLPDTASLDAPTQAPKLFLFIELHRRKICPLLSGHLSADIRPDKNAPLFRGGVVRMSTVRLRMTAEEARGAHA
jgi:hypothetical protein